MTEWARRIKQRREALGMSVAGLARACGIRPPSIHNWEGGRTKAIEGQNLVAAARALGVSPEWILTGNEHTPARLAPPPSQGSLHVGVATTVIETVTIAPLQHQPNPVLLDRAVTEALAALRRRRLVPTDDVLARTIVLAYQILAAGQALTTSRRALDDAMQKAVTEEHTIKSNEE